MLSIKSFKYTVVLHEYLASHWVTLPATHKVWGLYKACKQLSPYIIVFMLFCKCAKFGHEKNPNSLFFMLEANLMLNLKVLELE